MNFQFWILVYIVAINIVTVIVTLMDKYYAITRKYRVSENTLISLALLGGCASEYCVMNIIRHKTRKKKFMIGLPLMCIAYAAVLTAGMIAVRVL